MKIEKVKIIDGVYWVEIKEVNLKILCGSPSDIVKHLIKMGLNKWIEANGVMYESGPNAILLADTPIQNGQLSNLSEFPILQMFYRQGLIIPNHPNNTGIKPLLIGSQEQIISQTNYVYRGNYGLISKEEVLEAGVSDEFADNVMRMKLKFAFGKMVNPKELLDTVIVRDNQKTSIVENVHIMRKSTNVYSINYKSEAIEIDLNLYNNQKYKAPYELQYMEIKKDYFAVIHSGQGDGWNTHQPSMSSIILYQGKIYLVDSGPNIEAILEALGIGMSEVDGIFHTHSHDDHFAGLTNQIKSDKKIKYYATKLVRESVIKKFSALLNIEEEKFYDYFDVINLEFDKWNDIDGLEVMPIFSPHPVETNLFMFRTIWKYGYKTYAHFADLTSFDVLEKMITTQDPASGISQDFFEKTKSNYLKYADIKKVDVGGGMIHGASIDFTYDKSQKIILAHTSKEITNQDKQIGSTASFGTVDVLIPAHQDYERKRAFEFLKAYHENLPRHILDIFVNLEVVSFNPGTIILKKGEKVKNIYIVLSGVAEAIYSDKDMQSSITSGAIVGKLCALLDKYSKHTVRTVSFVKALKIPVEMFLKIVNDFNLYPNIAEKLDRIEFLKENNLFNNYISYPTLDMLTKSMQLQEYKKDTKFTLKNDGKLYLVHSGTLDMTINDTIIKSLQNGDFFGEEDSVFDLVSPFNIIATSDIKLYSIDGEVLKHIPIVKWKLFEEFRKKEKILWSLEKKYVWSDNLSIGVQIIDIQLEKILSYLTTLSAVSSLDISNQTTRIATIQIIDKMISYLKYHFENELKLLVVYKYDAIDEYANMHIEIINISVELLDNFKNNSIDISTLIEEIYRLVLSHISKSKEYAKYLNNFGIY